jgi:hypothetical protein
MAIFYVGYMDGSTFVPMPPIERSDETKEPQLGDVYVGGGAVREVVGILKTGDIMTVLLEDEQRDQALKHLWDSEEE